MSKLPPNEPPDKFKPLPETEEIILVASLVMLPVIGTLDSIPEPEPPELMIPLLVILPTGKVEPNKASAVPVAAVIEPVLLIAPVILPKELMALTVGVTELVEIIP